MSVSFFIGFHPRDDNGLIIEDPESSAPQEIEDLNQVLTKNQLTSYAEPEVVSSPYQRQNRFGRSQADHTGSQSLSELATLATERKQLYLLRNIDLVAFLPGEFDDRPECALAGTTSVIGSLPKLVRELTALADRLGIVLKSDELGDQVATKINKGQKLGTEKTRGLDLEEIVDARFNWLLLFEGARLAMERNVALVLRT